MRMGGDEAAFAPARRLRAEHLVQERLHKILRLAAEAVSGEVVEPGSLENVETDFVLGEATVDHQRAGEDAFAAVPVRLLGPLQPSLVTPPGGIRRRLRVRDSGSVAGERATGTDPESLSSVSRARTIAPAPSRKESVQATSSPCAASPRIGTPASGVHSETCPGACSARSSKIKRSVPAIVPTVPGVPCRGSRRSEPGAPAPRPGSRSRRRTPCGVDPRLFPGPLRCR
jgi:hypothetical protein